MKGYKAFYKRDGVLSCGGWHLVDGEKIVSFYKVYEIGKTFEEDGVPKLCEHGMHFCKKLLDVFWYKDKPDVICEVETPEGALIDKSDKEDSHKKFCTNKLTIVRELSIDEIETIIEKEEKRRRKTRINIEYFGAKAWIESKRSKMIEYFDAKAWIESKRSKMEEENEKI